MKKWINEHRKGAVGILMALLVSVTVSTGVVPPEIWEFLGWETESGADSKPETERETEKSAESDGEPEQTYGAEDGTEVYIHEDETEICLDPDGVYTSMEDVSLYLYLYEELPDNFMTKAEARKLGWEGGSLEPYAPGMCIGGDRFGNYEGLLPEADGRSYKECDIDTLYADSRGAKRIVFSNDGLIYYTEDHYESFELIYPEED